MRTACACQRYTGVGLFYFLLVVGLGARGGNGQTEGNSRPPECEAVVEYTAVTGDPAKANKSAIFRGFTRIMDLHEREADGATNLRWTFSEGENIQGPKDVFKDPASSALDAEEFKVSFNSTRNPDSDQQTVFLKLTGDETSEVDIGFVAYKGYDRNRARDDPDSPNLYKVGTPQNVIYNNWLCISDKTLTEEYESLPDESHERANNVIELEYLPIEFSSMRFYSGFSSNFAIYTFRIRNSGSTPINLQNIQIEYWFDGGEVQDSSLFEAACMTSTINCSNFAVDVVTGLREVSGAHFKVQVGFTAEAGILAPEPQGLSLPGSRAQDRNALYTLEAIVNITSKQFFSQMDVTKDYSFLNTTLINDDTYLPEQLVARKYEANPQMPVFLDGKLVWGHRPIAGTDRIGQGSGDSSGTQCWFKKPGIRQCGLRVKYCCSEPPPGTQIVPAPDNSVKPAGSPIIVDPNYDGDERTSRSSLPTWVVPLAVGIIAFLVLGGCCLFCVMRAKLKKSDVSSVTESAQQYLGTELSHREQFGSFAWSIVGDHHVHGGPDAKKKKGFHHHDDDDDEFEPLIRKDTKFHTVPSISGMDACLLRDIRDREAYDPRELKTWTGHVHWLWEPWSMASVRRAATAMPPAGKASQYFTLSTRKLPNVPLNIDFKTEIDPYIGEHLGEGGFGTVYAAKWKGHDVAVKVLKVDSEAMHKSLEDEIKLTSKMHHDRIVKLIGACLSNKDNICLIMELVEGGNLSRRIHRKSKRRLDYLEVLHIGHDIAEGLAYLHPTVIHRDLKPQNVLLDKDGRAKIADFGISKFKDPHRSYLSVTQTGGTPNYMAPELFNGTRVDEKCDIFSLGCILYEAMARRVPLSDLPNDNCAPLFQIIKTVAIDKRRPKIPEKFPPDMANLIRACWKDNPRSRPGAVQVMKEIETMIDDEVLRLRRVREKAHALKISERRDSGNSSTGKASSGKRSPMLDLLGLANGRYTFLTGSSRGSPVAHGSLRGSGESSSRQPSPEPKLLMLTQHKSQKKRRNSPVQNRTAGHQKEASIASIYHSVASNMYFTADTQALEALRNAEIFAGKQPIGRVKNVRRSAGSRDLDKSATSLRSECVNPVDDSSDPYPKIGSKTVEGPTSSDPGPLVSNQPSSSISISGESSRASGVLETEATTPPAVTSRPVTRRRTYSRFKNELNDFTIYSDEGLELLGSARRHNTAFS